MSLKIWIFFMFGFAIYLRSSAQFCVRRFVNGQWISKGDCGGPERMSEMQKELQRKIKDEKKCIPRNGWTVFQRRINGDVDFFRGWDDYENGFGDCDGDLWLGLEELHERTKEGNMELEIHMIIKERGIHWVVKYSNFSIGPGSDKYRLHISGYSSNSTERDALAWSNNKQFSTKDADHDDYWKDCASTYEGAWWYGDSRCADSNLNGNFHGTDRHGFWWGNPNLLFSEMKIRKRA